MIYATDVWFSYRILNEGKRKMRKQRKNETKAITPTARDHVFSGPVHIRFVSHDYSLMFFVKPPSISISHPTASSAAASEKTLTNVLCTRETSVVLLDRFWLGTTSPPVCWSSGT